MTPAWRSSSPIEIGWYWLRREGRYRLVCWGPDDVDGTWRLYEAAPGEPNREVAVPEPDSGWEWSPGRILWPGGVLMRQAAAAAHHPAPAPRRCC